jgi:hypothetical protein
VCSVVKIGTQRKKITSPITTSNRLNRTLMPMHPRTTHGCPLVLLKSKNYKLFINNVNSPGFMKPSMFNAEGIRLTTDAVTCQRRSGTTVVKVGKKSFVALPSNFGVAAQVLMTVFIWWMSILQLIGKHPHLICIFKRSREA